MKTNDLRIGNYIYGNYYGSEDEEKTEKCKVLGIDSVGFSEYPIWVEGLEETGIETYMGFQPIPLTEEWLLKFGFKKLNDDTFYYTDVKLKINQLKKGSTGYDKYIYFKGLPIKPIHSVHQLQNLYFALTGEELTISE